MENSAKNSQNSIQSKNEDHKDEEIVFFGCRYFFVEKTGDFLPYDICFLNKDGSIKFVAFFGSWFDEKGVEAQKAQEIFYKEKNISLLGQNLPKDIFQQISLLFKEKNIGLLGYGMKNHDENLKKCNFDLRTICCNIYDAALSKNGELGKKYGLK